MSSHALASLSLWFSVQCKVATWKLARGLWTHYVTWGKSIAAEVNLPHFERQNAFLAALFLAFLSGTKVENRITWICATESYIWQDYMLYCMPEHKHFLAALLVHGQVTIIFVVSVCLCRVFLSRLWSDFDQTWIYVICLGLVVSARI